MTEGKPMTPEEHAARTVDLHIAAASEPDIAKRRRLIDLAHAHAVLSRTDRTHLFYADAEAGLADAEDADQEQPVTRSFQGLFAIHTPREHR